MEEALTITKEDRDLVRLTGSRLEYGARLTRRELLLLAVMSSENRAAAALGRNFPGGMDGFVDENGKFVVTGSDINDMDRMISTSILIPMGPEGEGGAAVGHHERAEAHDRRGLRECRRCGCWMDQRPALRHGAPVPPASYRNSR